MTKSASDFELESVSNDIYNLVRTFDSPKDAAIALAMAQFKMIKASFPPEEKNKAIVAIDAEAKLLKDFINEGWQ